MALYSPAFKITVLFAHFQAAASSHISQTFEVVSGPCTIRADKCVYSDLEWMWAWVWSWRTTVGQYANNQDCVIKQNVPFKLDVRSFDVEYHSGCAYDFLKVNSEVYCGTQGPHGVTPAAGSELIWHTDISVTRAGFKICAVSRQPPRHTSSDCGPWHKICGLHTCTPHRSSDSSPPHTSCLLPLLKYALAHTTP